MKTEVRAVEKLRAAGRRVTRERELLLGIIDRNPHLDATEIYRIAKDQRPQIGLATVYRTLNLLKEIGLVRTCELGESHRHYEVRQDDHLHLICSDCGRVLDIPSPESLRTLAEEHGFRVERTRLELIGRCESCARSRNPASRKGS